MAKTKRGKINSTYHMIILDKGARWTDSAARFVHWTEMNVPEGHYSIPLLVERQAAKLRDEHLAWVHHIGEHSIGQTTLRESLRLGEGFSFWWMTLIAEKSPMKSMGIYSIMKLRVLETLWPDNGCQGIILCSDDRSLNRVIKTWCRNKGLQYKWNRIPKQSQSKPWKIWFQSLPHPFRAFVWLTQWMWMRRRHVRNAKPIPENGNQATVVTYFPNVDDVWAQEGIFISRLWEGLHEALNDEPCSINWILFYAPGGQYSFPEAIALRRRFEKSGLNRGRFFFLEEFVTFSVFLKSLKNYLYSLLNSFKLRPVKKAFHYSGSSMDFFPILARDWYSSLRGNVAMQGCLMASVFQEMVDLLPRQKWGMYLWESQSWEKALIHAWKTKNKGNLIGYQHASMCNMDFRNFEDRRSYALTSYPPLFPDVLAVNGKRAWDLLRDAGFPEDRLKLVEAVRYMNLNREKDVRNIPIKESSLEPTLLVVTGSFYPETKAQLQLLNRLAKKGKLKNFEKILIKPHPICPVEEIMKNVAPDTNATVVNKPLSKLLNKATAVYSANSTSAALEAAFLELPLVIHLDGQLINLSPLSGLPEITFAAGEEDLLNSLNSPRKLSLDPNQFFCLDEGLTKWRELLHDFSN